MECGSSSCDSWWSIPRNWGRSPEGSLKIEIFLPQHTEVQRGLRRVLKIPMRERVSIKPPPGLGNTKPDYFGSGPKETLLATLPVSICIGQSQRGRSYSYLVFTYCIEMSNFWLEAALWLEAILGRPVWQEWKVNSYDMLEFFLSAGEVSLAE